MAASASNNRSMGGGLPKGPLNEPPRQRRAGAHLRERREAGKWAAAALALIVHVALVVLIVVGVSWQVKAPPAVMAEMWSQLPPIRNAGPTPAPPVETPPTPPPVEPPPVEKSVPPPPTPQPVVPKAPPPVPEKAAPGPSKADIALKVEREAKEKKLREEAEAADKKKRDQLKVDEDRKKVDEDRKKAETERKKREEESRKDDARRMEAESRARQDQAQKEQQARMVGEQQQRAALNDYGAKIQALIRSRANVPDTVTGKPKIQVRLRLLVNGAVLDASVVTPSGNRVYDEAIERAINGIMQWPLPDNVELLGGRRELILKIESEK
jgi:colicin import membrane protein